MNVFLGVLIVAVCFSAVVIVIGVVFGLQARRDKKSMDDWMKRNGYGK